ncbi:class I SAM-dependent methyltransferase [Rhodococcus sp. AW25M09]|uniref:class I SAM-dependent methyltransferase n=1 Tax=Rhodococcus sp. AW25M09 TaxID=1268303 RepID=UPI00034B121E|nr:methyltransferase [Rhodococcus sp. AW25M09]
MPDESLFDALRREPDAEAPNLHAVDAADRLVLDTVDERPDIDRTAPIAVIGDRYGALTLGAVGLGFTNVRVHQDAVTGIRALELNAARVSMIGSYTQHELGAALLDGVGTVLMQLPRGLAELTEMAEHIAAHARADVVVLAGGRDKHMTPAMNDVLRRSFETVTAGRGRQKARVLTATGAVASGPTYPVSKRIADLDMTVVAHGAVFAGAGLDLGTRFLLEYVPKMSPRARTAVDLGCGTGILATELARTRPGLDVIATDRSSAATASAAATAVANGTTISVVADDAMSTFESESIDLVVCNPPFHEGAAVHTGGASKLFAAAGRVLRPGGQLWTVYNTHLNYRRELADAVGPTDSMGRNSKFTVARSVRPSER